MIEPDCKWNVKQAQRVCKTTKNQQLTKKRVNQQQWRQTMELELFVVRKAFKPVSLKGMRKSFNKRYVK